MALKSELLEFRGILKGDFRGGLFQNTSYPLNNEFKIKQPKFFFFKT